MHSDTAGIEALTPFNRRKGQASAVQTHKSCLC